MLQSTDTVEPGFGAVCATWGFPIEAIKAESDEEINTIYRTLECPVCHEFPKAGDIYSCKNNRHIICDKCLPESRICPGCLDLIPLEKSFVAETCISNFLIPCKYKFQGCPEIIRGESVRFHLSNCTYRPIPCIMAKCTDVVPFKKLWTHLLETHGGKVNGVSDSQRHIVEWWIEGDVHATARWPPFYLTAFDNVFLYMCVSTIHGTWEWVWVLANDEEASRFKVETKMENLENGMAIQWKGPVHPIRKHVKDIIASGQVFVTNSKEIRNPFLFKKGNDDKSFWRTEIVIHQVNPPLPTSMPYCTTNDPTKNFLSRPKDSWAYEVDQSNSVNPTTQVTQDTARIVFNKTETGNIVVDQTERTMKSDDTSPLDKIPQQLLPNPIGQPAEVVIPSLNDLPPSTFEPSPKADIPQIPISLPDTDIYVPMQVLPTDPDNSSSGIVNTESFPSPGFMINSPPSATYEPSAGEDVKSSPSKVPEPIPEIVASAVKEVISLAPSVSESTSQALNESSVSEQPEALTSENPESMISEEPESLTIKVDSSAIEVIPPSISGMDIPSVLEEAEPSTSDELNPPVTTVEEDALISIPALKKQGSDEIKEGVVSGSAETPTVSETAVIADPNSEDDSAK